MEREREIHTHTLAPPGLLQRFLCVTPTFVFLLVSIITFVDRRVPVVAVVATAVASKGIKKWRGAVAASVS